MISSRDPNQTVTRKMLEYNTTYEATERTWNGRGYECYLCHLAYTSLAGLNLHVASAHKQNLYHCPKRICAKEFVSLAGLFNHLESESCGYTKFEAVNSGVNRFFDSGRMIAL
jgi:hypothetical protein